MAPKLTGGHIKLGRRLVSEGTSVPEESRIFEVHFTMLYRTLQP
jgi:hypothetical protein